MGALSLVLTAACGDDDDGGNPVDARTIDTAVTIDADTTPDAMPNPVRSGTVAVIEAKVTNPAAAAVGGLEGANITVHFSDGLTGVAPVTGFENPVNGCLVRVYDLEAGDTTATPVDEGIVQIAGTSNGNLGCAFNSTSMEYNCANPGAGFMNTATAGDTATPVTVGGVPIGLVKLKFSGKDFTTLQDNLRGMWIVVQGFSTQAGDGDAGIPPADINGADNALPVLYAGPMTTPDLSGVGGAPAITLAADEILVGSGSVASVLTVGSGGGGFATVAGAASMPGLGTPPFTTFLDNGEVGDGDAGIAPGADYTIQMASSPAGCTPGSDGSCRVEAFSITLKANGGGFKLDDNSAQPYDMCPGATSSDISSCSAAKTFSCHETGGVCGEGSHGTLKVLAISGETTDAVLPTTGSPLDFTEMPDPVKKYATWQCSFVGGAATGGTIPAAAMAAIMGTNPTRIFTQVLHVGGNIFQNDPGNPNKSTTNVVLGHGVAGFTDVPGAVGQTP
jgi:hypothetical protein